MTRPTARRPARRAVAVGGLLLVTALAAHAAAGGAPPSVAALVVPAALSLLVAAVLTGTRPRRSTALALVSAGQYAVHTLLVLSASHPVPGGSTAVMPVGPVEPAAGAVPGHPCLPVHGHGAVAACLDGGMAAGPTGASDVTMLGLHVAATLATGLLLGQGDRLLGWLVAALRPGWRPPVLPMPPVRLPGRVTVPGAPLAASRTQVWVRVPPRRGPPRGAGVVRHATT